MVTTAKSARRTSVLQMPSTHTHSLITSLTTPSETQILCVAIAMPGEEEEIRLLLHFRCLKFGVSTREIVFVQVLAASWLDANVFTLYIVLRLDRTFYVPHCGSYSWAPHPHPCPHWHAIPFKYCNSSLWMVRCTACVKHVHVHANWHARVLH